MSLRPTGFNEASRMSRNSFGFKSLHTNSAQHVRAADKFRRPDKAAFLRHKYANGGALGTLFSKPHWRVDWIAHWGIAAERYASRVVDQPEQE